MFPKGQFAKVKENTGAGKAFTGLCEKNAVKNSGPLRHRTIQAIPPIKNKRYRCHLF